MSIFRKKVRKMALDDYVSILEQKGKIKIISEESYEFIELKKDDYRVE